MGGHESARLAGQLQLDTVMAALARVRPLFHSEADFQFAFARQVWELPPDLTCRLEVPFRRATGRAEYVDLLLSSEDTARTTAVEFKYFTRGWAGEVGGEHYELRNHAASDLARLHFVHDIHCLEGFASSRGTDGVAIMLTNEPSLWLAPRARQRRTNFDAFRIHQGQTLTGVLQWGNGFAGNQRELTGSYQLHWNDYSFLHGGGAGGALRWTAVYVRATGMAGT